MKILLVTGTPQATDSNSEFILKILEDKLGDDNEFIWRRANAKHIPEFLEELESADAMVLCFPLYVDAIPSHLLNWMIRVEEEIGSKIIDAKFYLILHCGFYDAVQTKNALEMTKIWVEKCRLNWGQALLMGGVSIIRASPIGVGPTKNFGVGLNRLRDCVLDLRTDEDEFVEPNFPRWLYMIGGNLGWKDEIRQNGLNPKDLFNRVEPYGEDWDDEDEEEEEDEDEFLDDELYEAEDETEIIYEADNLIFPDNQF